MDLEFIGDERLKTRIKDSVEYALTLLEDENLSKNQKSRQETYRIIILYCVSIMEAIFLYIHHNSKDKVHKQEFKDVRELTSSYLNNKYEGKVVVAVRTDTLKAEPEIGFQELVNFFTGKILKETTVKRIIKIAQKRNTFHLRKNGSSVCTLSEVEEAFALLELCIKNSPRFVK